MKKPNKEKEKKNNYYRYLGVASTVGINFVATTFVGFALGHWVVDPALGTDPWFSLILMFIGIAAGFKYLFKLAKRAGDYNKEENDKREM